MNRARLECIARFAEECRKTLGLSTPISLSDLKKAVGRLGGTIEFQEKPPLPMDIDAIITKKGTSFIITIADSGDVERMKFSLAHELGHLFLHMGYLVDDKKWSALNAYPDFALRRSVHGREEFEANEFSASLLMPASEFRDVADSFYDGRLYNIQSIAAHFSVSKHTAGNRGSWLGVFASEWI